MNVDAIKKELEELERLEDLAPTNELFYLCGGDGKDITLCHKVRIGQEFYNYFKEDRLRIAEFLSNKKRNLLSFQDHKYICETPILHIVYNGAPYCVEVNEPYASVFKKYHIVVSDTPVFEQCRVDVNRLGCWLHIEHCINYLEVDALLTDMAEKDIYENC